MSMSPRGYQLSPIQQGMLIHHLRSPQSGADIEQMVVSIHETVDPKALRTAWDQLTAANDVLRTAFEWDTFDHPLQRIEADVSLPWNEVDCEHLSEADWGRFLDAFLADDRRRGFDMRVAPLARCTLFRRGLADWTFVWTFHHILADGQSYPQLVREGFGRYDGLRGGNEVSTAAAPAYRTFIDWQQDHLTAQAVTAEAFWRSGLENVTPCALPFHLAPSTSDSTEPDMFELSRTMPTGITGQLRTIGAASHFGLSAVLEAAWAWLLHSSSGTHDVLVGVTRACRRSTVPEADRIVGSFINTVPARVRIDPGARVIDWLRAVREQSIRVREFEHTRLVDVLKWSGVSAGMPLFDSLIVYTPRLLGAALRDEGGAWATRDVSFREQTNFPVTIFGYGERDLLVKIAYDRRRITTATVERWLDQFETVLTAMAENPEGRVGDLPLTGPSEAQTLSAWNATARDYEEDDCIHELFERQAKKTPQATALVFRDRRLTYAELDAQASALGRHLQSLGAGPGTVAGIYVERSMDMVVGLLGILKAGAAYLPLDPSYPREPLSLMIEDAGVEIVVTQRHLAESIPGAVRHRVVLENVAAAIPPPAAPRTRTASPDDLAYLIFTSGSTGRPKGVMVRHRNVTNFFAGMDDRLDAPRAGTWLAVTSISFDISVLELFWTLSRGFTVIIQETLDRAGLSSGTRARSIDFSLFYFSAAAQDSGRDKYRLLLEGARYADEHGFAAVWTPERHFHEFGGLYPNPSVTSAAIAAITSRIKIRAGSVVLPLHDPIRVAEEWSVVDNLSGGRVGLSFASGWHANDFALKPEAFADRRRIMSDSIDTVRRLWRGEAVRARSGSGEDIDVRIFPRPVQAEPDLWVTTAGNVDTFRLAGQTGANILTNLLGQTVEEVAEKIAAYRQARRDAGHRGDGQVTLMLHTFVGTDVDEVRELVRGPFIDYLKTSTELVKKARWEFPAFAAGGKQTGQLDNSDLSEQEIDAMMGHAFDRYFETSGLFGTPDSCAPMIARLKAAGVDEIACLLDFGVATDTVLENLASLNELRRRHSASQPTADYSIAGQIDRHGVTHMQGTPSLFRALAADAGGHEALSHVGTLLVGGEQLPPALAADLLQGQGRKLLNMYGPTETTVWSSVASIEDATQPITIGRPIANTEIYIARPDGRRAPIGATGELLIGGAGVTKGYWNRPDLTAERFVPNPFVPDAKGLLYRTGDLARYREDGTIEFLGRADHQIKLHGHRIELGEIEAVLESHAAVRQAVVALDRSTGDEGRLVAYVVPADEGTSDAGATATSEWQRVWEESYGQDHKSDDATFNTTGWISSYTGQPIPADEMREWLEHTATRILDLPHRRVLEIGCGTGLVLFKVAPHCEEYVGLDFSSQAVTRVEREARRRGLAHVSVHTAAADALAGLVLGREPFDLVILNSVVQYFPDADYLIRVLERAATIVRPGGAVFVGDLRNLAWLEAFHASVEIERAPADSTREDLRRRIQERVGNEPELVLDPAFFRHLPDVVPRFSGTTLYLKRGKGRNEMVRFRYDAVLRVDAPGHDDAPRADVDIAADASLQDIRNVLGSSGDDVRLRGIVNGRVALDRHALDLLRAPDGPATVGELRQRLGSEVRTGIDPDDAARLDGMDIDVLCSERDPWTYDLVSRAGAEARTAAPYADHARLARTDLARFSNQPRRARAGLPGLLKQHVRDRLPPYMAPSVFMTLETLPLTSNGKIDRKRLPSPERTRVDTVAVYVAPASELEQQISRVWQELLQLERVSVDDNFFDMGANSLLMVRAQMGLAEALNRSVSLVDFFRFPTVRSLARALSDPGGDSPVLADSALRAQSRRDALERRRHGRTLTRQTLEP